MRDLSDDYLQEFEEPKRENIKVNFIQNLADLIRETATRHGWKVRLLAMHHFHVGDDDRYFNASLAEDYLHDLDVEVVWEPYSLKEILQSMQDAACCICMRYHSIVFAHHLSRKYIAVDYTNGGKIESFIQEKNETGNLISFDSMLKYRGRTKVDHQ